MHSVGVIGLCSEDILFYKNLSWLNLCIVTILFFINFNPMPLKLVLIFLLLMIGGFFVEFLGVRTDKIFGDYAYTDVLGYQIGDVPIVIALNWAVLSISCAIIAAKNYSNLVLQLLSGGMMLVLIDVFLEPSAKILGFWKWYNNEIPLQNYFAWFFIGTVFIFICLKFLREIDNKLAYWIVGIQLLFFSIINLFL